MPLINRRNFLSLMAPAFGLAGCGKPPAPPFRLATYLWPGYEPFFLAREMQMLGNHRIQLLEFPSAAECILAFQNRVVDAVTLTADEVIRLAQAGHEPQIVMLIDFSNGTDVIVAKREFASLRELKGKVIGVENNTLGSFFLARALEVSGLTSADVKTVNCRADQCERDFALGKLDAAVTYDPYRQRMVAAGARQIFDSSKLPGEIMDTLVVRRSVMDNPPRALSGLVSGWFQALESIAKNPAETAGRMAPRENATPEALLESLKGIQLLGRKENRELLGAKNSLLPAKLQRLADYLLKSGLIATPVDTAHLLNGTLVMEQGP